jgi:hypothetical protein
MPRSENFFHSLKFDEKNGSIRTINSVFVLEAHAAEGGGFLEEH